jgi:hypothetical protein
MTVRLDSLRFVARDPAGLGTPELRFGNVLTLVLGNNGSGKTVILKGLAYALGHPIELPPEIRARSNSVVVGLREGDTRFLIERQIQSGFAISVTGPDGAQSRFDEEKSFGRWMIARLGMPDRKLVSRDGSGVIEPYMSVLLPAFWIDQDLGWRGLYCPLSTHSFVRDQAEEVSRWLLDVPARNRSADRADYEEAKQRLLSIQERVVIKRKTLAALRLELGTQPSPGERDELGAMKRALVADLNAHNSVLETITRQSSGLDSQVRGAIKRRNELGFRLNSDFRANVS